jgi:hypothetical protein
MVHVESCGALPQVDVVLFNPLAVSRYRMAISYVVLGSLAFVLVCSPVAELFCLVLCPVHLCSPVMV